MKKTILFALTLLVFYSCNKSQNNSSTASETDLITDEPTVNDFNLGEQWVWMEKSVVEENTRWEGRELLEVIDYNGTPGFWNGYDSLSIASTLSQNQSSTPFRDWPLKVGKKWTYHSEWKNAEGTTMTTNQDVEVVSYGEVVVLAGRFMAYEIVHTGTFTNSSGGSGTMNETFWYAPALKKDIRHIQDDGYGSYVLELYDYKSGQ